MNRCTAKIVLSICVCVGAGSRVLGGGVCVWTGAVDDDWFNAGNWDTCNGGFPCTGDTVRINCSNCNAFPSVKFDDVTQSCTLDDLDVSAALATTLALDIKNGTLALGGLVPSTLIQGGDTNSTRATITVSGGTFDPGDLKVFGGGSNGGTATFAYVSGTVTQPDGLTMRGLSTLDINETLSFSTLDVTIDNPGPVVTDAEMDVVSAKTLTLRSVTVDPAQAAATLKKSGAGTLDVSSMTVEAGDLGNESATLWLFAGDIVIGSNALTLHGGNDSSRTALFDFDGGTFPAPGQTNMSIIMTEYSKIDAEQDIDLVNGDLVVPAGSGLFGPFPAVAEIDMAAGKQFTVDSVFVAAADNSNDTATLDLTGAGDFTTGAVAITGGTGSGATAGLTVTTTGVFTTAGLVTIAEGTGVGASAELDIGAGLDAALDSVRMTGNANLKLASNTQVKEQFKIIASGATDPTLNLNNGVDVTLEIGSLEIDPGVTFAPSFRSGSVLITR